MLNTLPDMGMAERIGQKCLGNRLQLQVQLFARGVSPVCLQGGKDETRQPDRSVCSLDGGK